jgi:uncharacterized membrane protein HdeD (DUF308 family)
MKELQKNWPLIASEGVLFLVLGSLAIIMPIIFSFGIVLTVGVLLVFGGLIQLFRTIKLRKRKYFLHSLFLSIIELLFGTAILVYPAKGLMFLTALLIGYFILAGVVKIIVAINLKPLKFWGWIFSSGLLSLIFAFLLIHYWPNTAAFTIGILFGVNMIFFGFSLIFAGIFVRSINEIEG